MTVPPSAIPARRGGAVPAGGRVLAGLGRPPGLLRQRLVQIVRPLRDVHREVLRRRWVDSDRVIG